MGTRLDLPASLLIKEDFTTSPLWWRKVRVLVDEDLDLGTFAVCLFRKGSTEARASAAAGSTRSI